ncbi:hypothetical protein [Bacillus sp. MUM 13]|nr:hypothetical protein [Bacillus sp. MUM 13]
MTALSEPAVFLDSPAVLHGRYGAAALRVEVPDFKKRSIVLRIY